MPIVYGSGFDAAPSQLSDIANPRRVLGTTIDSLECCNHPRRFNALLRELTISAPLTCFDSPSDVGRWLIKRPGGSGGWHIREAGSRVEACVAKEKSASSNAVYFQQYVTGRSISLTAVTSAGKASVVGYADQTPSRHHGVRRFAFTGAQTIRASELHEYAREQMHSALEKLCQALSLSGLVSLDFIVDGEMCQLLEINPRLSATCELHDNSGALFADHIRACNTDCGDDDYLERYQFNTEPNFLSGCEIVFAPEDMSINAVSLWPDWLRDRPVPDNLIRKGEPVCTVYARHEDSARLAALLRKRKHEALSRLANKDVPPQ
jgi:predicted ATP-grasp superfamily ATP-dependent carboligase